MNWASKTKKGILAVALLLAIEPALRLVFGLGHPVLMKPSAAYGYMPTANQELYRLFSHVHINAFGMRSDDVVPGSNARRVLFVGDSVTFGPSYVDQAKIFTSRIQADLKNAHAEILNASAPGWAIANESGFLRRFGTFHAGLVVMVLNTQDLTQPFAELPKNENFPTEDPSSALSELWHRYLVGRFFVKPTRDAGSVASGDPAIETETRKVLAELAEAQQLARQHGAQFAIIFSPSAGSDVTTFRKHWQKGISMLMQWVKRENVVVIDMTSDYEREGAANVYFDGIHLRPRGHELIEKGFMRVYGSDFLKARSDLNNLSNSN